MKKLIAISAAAVALVMCASQVGAETIDLGYYNGSSVTQFATGSTGPIAGSGSFGAFSFSASATGVVDPGALSSNTIDVSSSGSGTLTIYASLQGVTGPVSSAVDWLSTFTSNVLPADWSVTESTYLDPADVAYALTDELASNVFTTVGADSIGSVLDPGAGPYSLTEVFTISSDGPSLTGANSTIDLAAVPLPAALPLFIGGLGVLGFAGLFGGRKQHKLA